jgi:GMP synthase (glutamine-hydrolysing)
VFAQEIQTVVETLRYLLLQVRKPSDAMRGHEVRRFAQALGCGEDQIRVWDLVGAPPGPRDLEGADVVLLGGSGDYSVSEGGHWLDGVLASLRLVHASGVPTFASCWGFQAMACAMGGVVVADPDRAEVGTLTVTLTPAGERDPVLGPLGRSFPAQIGHQDIVDVLPEGAILLASTERVKHHAYRFEDRPIYCTQFHPELDRDALLDRLRVYPTYVESIVGVSFEEFARTCRPSPETDGLLSRFVEHVVRGEARGT